MADCWPYIGDGAFRCGGLESTDFQQLHQHTYISNVIMLHLHNCYTRIT